MHYIRYKEIKNRGTSDFPIGYYHVNQVHPQYDMPYHWHDELEFIHILEGDFHVTVNEHSYTAIPGDIIIVNSGFLHGGVPHDCVYECLVFPCEILFGKVIRPSFLNRLNMQEVILDEYLPAISAGKISVLMEELFQMMKDTVAHQELIVAGLLTQIMGHLYADGRYTVTDKTDVGKHKNIYLLKNVLDYIEHHYPENIRLETLAKIAGMSPKYFCRFFYEMTGRTPIDYVNYYRIERACYRMVNSDDSITGISLSCGFNDAGYFTKMFRRYKEKTPRQYLKDTR